MTSNITITKQLQQRETILHLFNNLDSSLYIQTCGSPSVCFILCRMILHSKKRLKYKIIMQIHSELMG